MPQNHRTEITSPQLSERGIELLGHYVHHIPRDRLIRTHHGSCYEICYLESGMQPYCTYASADSPEEEAATYRLYGGDVFITRPYEYHSSGQFHQLRGQMYWMHIDADCPALLGNTEQGTRILKQALAGIERHVLRIPRPVSTRFAEAFALLTDMDEERLFRACALLSLFLLELAGFDRSLSSSGGVSGTLSAKGMDAVSFIHDHLLDPGLDLDMIAAHLHYSRSYVATAFHNEIGMTIHEYIQRCKIEQACELLLSHSVTETAFLLNFSSSQHFSRIFKAHTSMTPGEYARVNRAGSVE